MPSSHIKDSIDGHFGKDMEISHVPTLTPSIDKNDTGNMIAPFSTSMHSFQWHIAATYYDTKMPPSAVFVKTFGEMVAVAPVKMMVVSSKKRFVEICKMNLLAG
ncbi:hypothetical protein LOAG_03874 [Loa loa]|uniref:BURP domain-containing protein n=1 Tax=Loa loa TaxID=7209 RepID=A0A1I7VWC1_LOALO|nr:hypothetical protein LOAG_03874 [Loa loa]EFO24607.1 hypothetical protein LOAG_03874 [Loa loa]